MATAGSAIGLGSLWKFPYVTGENGGGLFVLAYLIFTFFIGVPIFMAELMIGRTASRAPVGAFGELSKQTSWRLLGWSCALATLLILSYYSVVAGWALNYTLCHSSISPRERVPIKFLKFLISSIGQEM